MNNEPANTDQPHHAAIWPYFCEDVVLQHNEVCETKTKFDGMAFDFDNSNQRCVYQYNYSHDNEGGFLNMCCDGNANGNVARYNISQNDGCLTGSRVFLVHGNGNHGYRVYNNTIYVRAFAQGLGSSRNVDRGQGQAVDSPTPTGFAGERQRLFPSKSPHRAWSRRGAPEPHCEKHVSEPSPKRQPTVVS
jgi:hypothetical protein